MWEYESCRFSKNRPTKASKEYFVGKTVQVDGIPQKISDQQATAIYRYLLKNDYIDDNEHITDQYRADLDNNALHPLHPSAPISIPYIATAIQITPYQSALLTFW